MEGQQIDILCWIVLPVFNFFTALMNPSLVGSLEVFSAGFLLSSTVFSESLLGLVARLQASVARWAGYLHTNCLGMDDSYLTRMEYEECHCYALKIFVQACYGSFVLFTEVSNIDKILDAFALEAQHKEFTKCYIFQ